jgi:hypothetical protein
MRFEILETRSLKWIWIIISRATCGRNPRTLRERESWELRFPKLEDSKESQSLIYGRHTLVDHVLQMKAIGERWSLRFEISEVRNPKTVRAINSRRTRGMRSFIAKKARFESWNLRNLNHEVNHERWFKKEQIWTVDQEAPPEIPRSTVTLHYGDRKWSDFKNMRAGAIETTVLEKGDMAAGGELWGEKWCGLKPL